MDFGAIVSTLHGWLFLLVSFAFALGLAMFKGRQMLINLMIGSYFGLFLLSKFPYLDKFKEQMHGESAKAIITLAAFFVFTILSAILFSRLMPREWIEGSFETMGKKILLALTAMLLVLALATYFLPLGALIDTGTPLPEMILSEKFTFAWLLLPLIALFFLA